MRLVTMQNMTTMSACVLSAIALLLAACADPVATDPGTTLEVTSVTIEHRRDPLGIDTAKPRLSWIVTADYNGAMQTAYEIRVSSAATNSGDVWSSGSVASPESFDVVYDGPPLTSNTRYYLSVRASDGEISSDWSSPTWFETAFLDISDFQGDWIGRIAERAENETPETLLRREFQLDNKGIDAARLYISGLGYYKAYLNGERIGDHELDPAFTPFDERVLYVTHDVTSQLKSGDNALGVSLGRGYYADYDNIDTNSAPWLSVPKLKLQLTVRFTDGSEQTVVSDTGWRTADGPTLTNSVKYGETYDARLEQPGWTVAGFDDAKWQAAVVTSAPTGALQAQDLEPVRVVDELPAPAVSEVSEDISLYDFGTTRAGWAKIGFQGPAGSTVTIRYGEKLTQDGLVNSGNDGPFGGIPVQVYEYTLRGDPSGESYTPSYSYNGYRFVQIEAPEEVTVTSVVGQAINNDVAVTGSFESSDKLLNRYHDAMIRSLLSNLHHIPTDTPMYEKRGWAADALLMVDSALINLASENFWEKWMLDHRYNQADDGGIAVIVPHKDPGNTEGDPFTGRTDDPIWSSSYVLVNHALYRQRGNVRTLRENYKGMQKWMAKWMLMLAESGYLVDGRTWGDHEPAYGSGMNNFLVGTAYIYRSAQALAEIAGVLDHDDDARTYLEFAEKLREAINASYYDAEAGHYDFPYEAPSFGPPPGVETPDTPEGEGPASGGGPPPGMPAWMSMPADEVDAKQFQTDNVLPLAMGLVPTGGRAELCEQLLDDVHTTHDRHITTGATVLKDVMPVLTDCGGAELAYEAAVNPTYPGWGYWFVGLHGTEGPGGETIIVDTYWEAWHEGARSHNHAFRGTIDNWLYQYLAGIRPTAPAYREILIKPYLVGEVSQVSASIQTPLGEARSSWQRDGTAFELEVQIPVGATAELQIPLVSGADTLVNGDAPAVGTRDGFAVFEVGSGTYTFVAN